MAFCATCKHPIHAEEPKPLRPDEKPEPPCDGCPRC
jgi:hypothetical protein